MCYGFHELYTCNLCCCCVFSFGSITLVFQLKIGLKKNHIFYSLLALQELFLFHSMRRCDIMNKGPPKKDIHFLIPRNCEYMALHGIKNFSDVTKILRLGDYYGLSSCDECNQKGPYEREVWGSEVE